MIFRLELHERFDVYVLGKYFINVQLGNDIFNPDDLAKNLKEPAVAPELDADGK